MIRLTLRQFRTEAIVGFGALAALAVVVAVTGVNLAQVNAAFQAGCTATGTCTSSVNPIIRDDAGLHTLLALVAIVAPASIGLFLGAPLVAGELETGTFRLAWTQSVTRRRWIAVKLALVGLAALVISGLLTVMVDWWQGPFDAASQDIFNPLPFGFHGIVPIGYTAFAFALGVTAGVVLRRTVAAMGATLVGFVAARIVVTTWIRPNLAAPLHESLPLVTARPVIGVQAPAGTLSLIAPQLNIPNVWVYGAAVVDKSGHPFTGHLLDACPALGQLPNVPPGPVIQACLVRLSATFHTAVTYQPASRFWPFQLAETSIFLAAALALCGLAYWWLRRRYGWRGRGRGCSWR